MTYKILSIDGGGIRGLISSILLQRLVKTPGLEHLLDEIDLVAGTSTGGLIALGIAHGLDLSQIVELYFEKGPDVFDDSLLDDILDLGRVRGAEYDIEPLQEEIQQLLGESTLGDLSKRVLITAFDLDNFDKLVEEGEVGMKPRQWKPKLFHNFEGEGNDRSELAYKVGLYTSAAPTYFPSFEGFVDGGVFANNPSMCALAQSQDIRYEPTPALEDVVLFSLGTGMNLYHIEGQTHDWGYAQWAPMLVTLMLDGIAGIADYQCSQLLNSQYHRLAPVIPEGVSVPLDAVSPDKMNFMVEFASEYPLDETIDWLRENWV
jgi:patatin-like phospholipase/acyl hydrolase